jgi:hypothetical protein
MFKWSVKGIVGIGIEGKGALEDQLPDWLLTPN